MCLCSFVFVILVIFMKRLFADFSGKVLGDGLAKRELKEIKRELEIERWRKSERKTD